MIQIFNKENSKNPWWQMAMARTTAGRNNIHGERRRCSMQQCSTYCKTKKSRRRINDRGSKQIQSTMLPQYASGQSRDETVRSAGRTAGCAPGCAQKCPECGVQTVGTVGHQCCWLGPLPYGTRCRIILRLRYFNMMLWLFLKACLWYGKGRGTMVSWWEERCRKLVGMFTNASD